MDHRLSVECNSDIEFKPDNMVVNVTWDEKINLVKAFILLPIQPVEIDCDKIKKKIPYYGIEDVIVSIRYKKQSRGIRPIPEKADNFVSIDLQINNKNVHIKLSENNVLVMGVVSVEKAIEATECLLDTIYMTDQNIKYLKSCEESEVKKAYKYVRNLAVDGKKSLDLPDIELFNSRIKEDSIEIDERLAGLFLTKGYETDSLEVFDENVVYMLTTSCISEDIISVNEYRICNSFYNYGLLIKRNGLPLKACFILRNLAGSIINLNNENITSSHHNWHGKYTDVVISTYGVSKGKLLLDKGKNRNQHIHRFNISERGSIRQWSPSSVKEARIVHQYLLCILTDIINNVEFVMVEEETT